jgi:hypothetical protein
MSAMAILRQSLSRICGKHAYIDVELRLESTGQSVLRRR